MQDNKIINAKKKISIVIPTKDRIDDLKECLNTIGVQSIPADEVIVVDGGKGNKTDLIIKKYYPSVIFCKYPKSTGLTDSKNFGVKRSNGDIIIFLDDDIVLEKNFIKNIVELFNRKVWEGIGGIAGNLTNQSFSPPKGVGYLIKKIFLLPMQGSGSFRLSGAPTFVYGSTEDKQVEFLPGGVTAWRREIFNEYSFDENLKQGSYGEDADFSYRVSRKYKNYYTPYANAFHKTSKTNRIKGVRLIMMRSKAFWYLARKNRNIIYYPFTSIMILGLWVEAANALMNRILKRFAFSSWGN